MPEGGGDSATLGASQLGHIRTSRLTVVAAGEHEAAGDVLRKVRVDPRHLQHRGQRFGREGEQRLAIQIGGIAQGHIEGPGGSVRILLAGRPFHRAPNGPQKLRDDAHQIVLLEHRCSSNPSVGAALGLPSRQRQRRGKGRPRSPPTETTTVEIASATASIPPAARGPNAPKRRRWPDGP